MNERALAAAWILVLAAFAGALLWAGYTWRSFASRTAQATAERARLTEELRQREGEIVKEMRANAGLLQNLQSSGVGSDPGVFLGRLAELAQGSRLRVTAIGGLEKQATPQYSKSWHTVRVTGPFRDIRELAARVEREKGVLEDLVVESRDSAPGLAGDDLVARFRVTALELSPEGKRILDRALVAAGRAGAERTAGLSLPLPSRPDGAADLRDPFLFGPSAGIPRSAPSSATAAPPPPAASSTSAPAPRPAPGSESPEVPMELRGIVGFPGGFLAILNNQIVKVGDSVAGYRVERIAEREVVLRPPEGGTRVVALPSIGASSAPPATPGRALPGPVPPPSPPAAEPSSPGR